MIKKCDINSKINVSKCYVLKINFLLFVLMKLIADNIQITHHKINKAIENLDPFPIQELVKKAELEGAEAIDINPGPLSRNGEEKMVFLINAIQDVSDLPVLLDTANARAVKAGLQANRKNAIINGFSLEPEKLKRILPLAKEFDVDIIGYLLSPNGHVPPDTESRLNVAVDLYTAFSKYGPAREHLIIDPVLVPVMWQQGNQHSQDVLSVIQALPDVLGFPVRTIAALSNLTTGNISRENKILLERTYLPMLAARGLSMLMLNIFHAETIKTARLCASLTGKGVFAWENEKQ
jgi:5-methyltetrahydrofolate corrinoid/iron sulfur protein methyltransferase